MKDNIVVRVPYSVVDVDGFDYATVSPDVARYLRGHATRLRQYISKSIIQIGKDLLSAKRYLPHGAFLEWVEREAGINPRTAQSYMHAAEWASNKSATVARLPPPACSTFFRPRAHRRNMSTKLSDAWRVVSGLHLRRFDRS